MITAVLLALVLQVAQPTEVLPAPVREHDHEAAFKIAMQFKAECEGLILNSVAGGDQFHAFMCDAHDWSVKECVEKDRSSLSILSDYSFERFFDTQILSSSSKQQAQWLKLRDLATANKCQVLYSQRIGVAVVTKLHGYFLGIYTGQADERFITSGNRPKFIPNHVDPCPSGGMYGPSPYNFPRYR